VVLPAVAPEAADLRSTVNEVVDRDAGTEALQPGDFDDGFRHPAVEGERAGSTPASVRGPMS
jgi:hypothetical protein